MRILTKKIVWLLSTTKLKKEVIAEKLNCSVDSVKTAQIRYNISRPKKEKIYITKGDILKNIKNQAKDDRKILNQKIKDCLLLNESVPDIAIKLNTTPRIVNYIKYKNKLKTTRKGKPYKVTDEVISQVKSLILSGKNFNAVAKIVGITRNEVRHIRNAYCTDIPFTLKNTRWSK